jgi:hypothetical protein
VKRRKYGRWLDFLSIFSVAVITTMMLSNVIPLALAQSINNSNVFAPDSKPYGLTYGEWSAKWWQWALSIPKQNSPLVDITGKNCDQKQSGTVWFLAATTGGTAERTCTIPHGKAIFFPVFNVECSFAENPDVKTDSGLSACAKSQLDIARNVVAGIDGQNLQDLIPYRVQSPPFNVTFANNNIFGVPAGHSRSVSDGYWIMVMPLVSGVHTIHFGGMAVDFTTTSTVNFATAVTYHLTVH